MKVTRECGYSRTKRTSGLISVEDLWFLVKRIQPDIFRISGSTDHRHSPRPIDRWTESGDVFQQQTGNDPAPALHQNCIQPINQRKSQHGRPLNGPHNNGQCESISVLPGRLPQPFNMARIQHGGQSRCGTRPLPVDAASQRSPTRFLALMTAICGCPAQWPCTATERGACRDRSQSFALRF